MKRQNKKPQSAAETARESWRRLVAEWATVLVVYLFVSTCVVQGYVIPTSSMENTLLVGDHLWVDKLAYAPGGEFLGQLLPYQDVKHGDIVVFRYPLNIEVAYVKRVIGLPGDRIRIENKQLIRNGSPVDEPYKVHKTAYTMAVAITSRIRSRTTAPCGPKRSTCCAITCGTASSLCRPGVTS